MHQNFTRRHRLDQPEYELRHEYVPPAFRFDVYKVLKEEIDSNVGEYCCYRDSSININKPNVRFWTADEIEENYNPDLFVALLQQAEWHEVLSLVELYVADRLLTADEANDLFDYHRVGYRYEADWGGAGGKVVVHFDSLIEDAEHVLEAEIKYEGVHASIRAAREALEDPEDIRQAHSVKQSIDAMEGYLRGWLAERGHKATTLGDAVKLLRNHSLCPSHVTASLEQFYVFRHRTPNAGHGAPEIGDVTKEDALLCLEMATSFINYFHRGAAQPAA